MTVLPFSTYSILLKLLLAVNVCLLVINLFIQLTITESLKVSTGGGVTGGS